MWKLYENFNNFHFQKRIVSSETIFGNTVFRRTTFLNTLKFEALYNVKTSPFLAKVVQRFKCQTWNLNFELNLTKVYNLVQYTLLSFSCVHRHGIAWGQ